MRLRESIRLSASKSYLVISGSNKLGLRQPQRLADTEINRPVTSSPHSQATQYLNLESEFVEHQVQQCKSAAGFGSTCYYFSVRL